MDHQSKADTRDSNQSGFPVTQSAVKYVENSFIGAPSSSFIHNFGAQIFSSSSSSSGGKAIVQGSSDSGNFLRASQPPTSVLGIPDKDRLFIKNRYGPKPRQTSRTPSRITTGSSRVSNHGFAQGGGTRLAQGGETFVTQQRHVMARLNPTGSQVQQTKLPSFILLNTRKTGNPMDATLRPKRTIQNDSESGDVLGASRPRQVARQLNASAAAAAAAATSARRVKQFNKGKHAVNCNKNFNAEATCNCESVDGKAKLNADVTTDIIPERRQRKSRNSANNFDDEDCEGESAFNWHVDASWGCKQYPEVYYCNEDCPSLLEYLLCPETDDCDDDDNVEMMKSADDEEEPDLEAVITLRQGESGDYEVRNLNVLKKDQDDFTVSWIHPSGSHPIYVVVVYPRLNSEPSKSRGPNCTSCAEEDGCICSTQPIFRKHIDGGQTTCDFPIECLEAGKSFVVEVATLNEVRDESFGTSLVIIDVYALNK